MNHQSDSVTLPRSADDECDDSQMFDLAPVSLWLEDYSALRSLFEAWRRDGVVRLAPFLHQDPARVTACSDAIRVLRVNQRTLDLYQAGSLRELVGNLGLIFRDDMMAAFIDELEQLWSGSSRFGSTSVNYALGGRRIDIQLRGSVLPGCEATWQRVLVAIEDVTEREAARRRERASEAYARGLFEHSPVSLWVEDFSRVKALLDDLRDQGITDFRVFTDVHPEFVRRCMSEIRVLDVNGHTLEMFGAPDKASLLSRLDDVFRDNMQPHFREQLIDLWHGKLFQRREVVNYALTGDELHVHLQFSVLPGHEHDWSLVQVALTDITARKKAEAYLEFLGKHDVLTKLHNRSSYVEELNRLERRGPFPVTVAIIDLNGLKAANDIAGHAAGDALLRRAGEVLGKAVEKPGHAARVGGDEFAVLLPGTDARGGAVLMDSIARLLALNNSFYCDAPLSLSIGLATQLPGERLEAVVKRADHEMYQAKRAFYAQVGQAPR